MAHLEVLGALRAQALRSLVVSGGPATCDSGTAFRSVEAEGLIVLAPSRPVEVPFRISQKLMLEIHCMVAQVERVW